MIQGFKFHSNNQETVELYDYNSLQNLPELDATLTSATQAAQAKVVGDIITNINTTGIKNILTNNVTWTMNKAIDASGQVIDGSDSCYSSLIPVKNELYQLIVKGNGRNINIRIHEYNTNGIWQRQITYLSLGESTEIQTLEFKINTNSYIRISSGKYINNIFLNEGSISIKHALNILEAEINNYKNSILGVSDISQQISWIENYSIPANGIPLANTDFHYSELIPMKAITYYLVIQGYGESKNIRVHKYNNEGVWQEEIISMATGTSTEEQLISFQGANNAYLRISIDRRTKLIALCQNKKPIKDALDELNNNFNNEIPEIRKQLLTSTNNLLNNNVTWITGKAINASGQITDGASSCYSSLIPVTNSVYRLVLRGNGKNVNVRIHEYNTNEIWQRQITYLSTATSTNIQVIEFTINNNNSYIRISSGLYIDLILLNEGSNSIKYALDKLEAEEKEYKNSILGITNILENIAWIEDYSIPADGIPISNTDYHYTEFIPVKTTIYYLTVKGYGESKNIRVHEYNSNGIWQKQLALLATGTSTAEQLISFQTTDNTFLRISTDRRVKLISLCKDRKPIKQALDELVESLSYKGEITTPNLDLNKGEFIKPGIWKLFSAANKPKNWGSANEAGQLVTFSSSSNSSIQTIQLIMDWHNNMYIRYSRENGNWNDWRNVRNGLYLNRKKVIKPLFTQFTKFQNNYNIPVHTAGQSGNVAAMYALYDSETAPGITITKTSFGKDSSGIYDIYRYHVSKNIGNRPIVLVIMGEHANEMNSAILGYYAYKEVVHGALTQYLDFVDFVFIPLLTPWGYDHGTRNNYNDVNINRDFPAGWSYSQDGHNKTGNISMSQVETNYIINYVFENKDNIMFAVNKHDTGTISRKLNGTEEDKIAYLSSSMTTDRIINNSICAQQNAQVRETDPWIINECIDMDPSVIELIPSETWQLPGSMDLFFNAIGIHASLLEVSYCTYDSSDTVPRYTAKHDADLRRLGLDFFVNYLATTIENCDVLLSSDETVQQTQKFYSRKLVDNNYQNIELAYDRHNNTFTEM